MYRVMALVEVKVSSFFGVDNGQIIAVSIKEVDDCVLCMVKLKPDSTPMSLGEMTWEEFFKWFEIKAFTEHCRKGAWPKGWSKTDEGKVYWR